MKANRSSNAKLVVVIEDDPLVLEATAGLLCAWGFQVIAAPCFENAMKQLSEAGRRPDLIVSDYRLSEGGTGVDAIEGLRNAFEIPALLISGDSRCPQAEAARDYQLLHKPVNPDSFRAALIEACVLRH
jgi:two-component system, sensor histidine kinase